MPARPLQLQGVLVWRTSALTAFAYLLARQPEIPLNPEPLAARQAAGAGNPHRDCRHPTATNHTGRGTSTTNELQHTEHRPSEIQPGDVIRYRLRSYLGSAAVRNFDPIRVVRVLDAVVVAADQPITVQGRRSVLLPAEADALIERGA
jgi:hypothetical protein